MPYVIKVAAKPIEDKFLYYRNAQKKRPSLMAAEERIIKLLNTNFPKKEIFIFGTHHLGIVIPDIAKIDSIFNIVDLTIKSSLTAYERSSSFSGF